MVPFERIKLPPFTLPTPQPDPYAELKKAHAEGKVIQTKSVIVDGWFDILWEPHWDKPVDNYRIKPDDEIPWIEWREKKPKVPLGPEDVPPGSAVRVKGFNGFAQVLAVSETGVQLYSGFFTWESLATENREINRSIPMTGKWDPDAWEACEK